QQVIDTARYVTGQDISVSEAPRRAGDPPRLVADPRRANTLLGWQAQFGSLEQIVAHAWSWEQKYPWH
ncbi:UDP-glucose 4-epimerase GalE, partial [Pseudomonas sp. P2663]